MSNSTNPHDILDARLAQAKSLAVAITDYSDDDDSLSQEHVNNVLWAINDLLTQAQEASSQITPWKPESVNQNQAQAH